MDTIHFVKENIWNSVSELKPKYNEKVLGYCVPKYAFDDDILQYEIQVCFLEIDDKWYLDDVKLSEIKEITHWQKMPENPILELYTSTEKLGNNKIC
jgi:hypothetical protein